MNRYIRTKDNKILDKQKLYETTDEYYDDGGDTVCLKKDIIAEGDNILDLIQVGDLYFYNIILTDRKVENQFDILGSTYTEEFMLAKLKCGHIELTKLYTKQGDNYILVWDKERGVI